MKVRRLVTCEVVLKKRGLNNQHAAEGKTRSDGRDRETRERKRARERERDERWGGGGAGGCHVPQGATSIAFHRSGAKVINSEEKRREGGY